MKSKDEGLPGRRWNSAVAMSGLLGIVLMERVLPFAAMLLLAWLSVSVALSDPVDERGAVGDGDLEARALQVDKAVRQALETEIRDLGLVNLLVADRAAKLDLQSVSILVDESSSPLSYNYSLFETDALNQSARHHIAVLSLSPGRHRIRATLVGVAGRGGQERIPVRVDAYVDVREGQQDVAVVLEDDSQFGLFYKTEVKVVSVTGNAHWADSAHFWQASGRRFAYLSDAAYVGLERDTGIAPQVPADEAWFDQFNGALASLSQGRSEPLEQLLRAEVADEGQRILRDQGHLLLGSYFLDRGDLRKAADYYTEVRRHGPYASQALIGLGWAMLNPVDDAGAGLTENPYNGSPQAGFMWSDSEDFIAWARRQSPFRNAWAVVPARKRGEVIEAMAPWMELVAGDPYDPAVQEAMLIVPYTLLHLGAAEQALKRYHQAGRQLRETVLALRQSIERVEQGKMTEELHALLVRSDSGWGQWLCGVDEAAPEAYIMRMLEAPDFLVAADKLRNLIDTKKVLMLRRSQARLALTADVSDPLVGEIDRLLVELDGRFEAQAGLAENAALGYLQRELVRTEAYLAEAHFALARLAEKRFGNFSEVVL